MPKSVPNQSGPQESHLQVRPDPKICRTRSNGTTNPFANPFATCLAHCRDACPYLMVFAKGRFCTHPNWRAFLT